MINGDQTIKKSAACNWYYKNGRESPEDERHNGRPTRSRSSENVAKVHKIVTSHECVMIGHIENKL
jgi:hypothetical protein